MSGQREFEDMLLSNEIIRALANELKTLRTRLVAIEDENRDLQAEMHRTTGEKEDLQMLYNVLKARNLEVEGKNHSLQQELHDARQCLQAASLKDEIRCALLIDSCHDHLEVKREVDEVSRQTMSDRLDESYVAREMSKRAMDSNGDLSLKQVKLESAQASIRLADEKPGLDVKVRPERLLTGNEAPDSLIEHMKVEQDGETEAIHYPAGQDHPNVQTRTLNYETQHSRLANLKKRKHASPPGVV